MSAVALLSVMSLTMAACGGNETAEAEEAAATYFSATGTGEWAAAAAASTGWARARALYYQYATPITGLPSGVLFNVDATSSVTADFDSLTEADGVLRATGTLSGGADLSGVEFEMTDDGIKVSSYLDKGGLRLEDFWSQGDSTDSGGGLVLTSLVGRMGRTSDAAGTLYITGYSWVSVVSNENSWPVSVDSMVFTPNAGGAPITWVQGQAANANGSTIAAQEEVPPGRSASIWVRQDATGTPQGGGILAVTLSGAGTSRVLSVELPEMSPPPGWQTVP